MPNYRIENLISRIDSMLPESTYLNSKPDRCNLASLYEALRFPMAPTPPMEGIVKMSPSLKKDVGDCCDKIQEANMKKYIRSAFVSIKRHRKILDDINNKALPYSNVNELTTANRKANEKM